MARDALSRNLRDGTAYVIDGDSPANSLTLILENGDLEWTQNQATREILDRGALDHTRPGDEQACDISYSLLWTQLIGYSTDTGNANEFWEMISNYGSTYTTTGAAGEQFMLKHQFNLLAPGGVSGNSEQIIFAKVFHTGITPSEGGDANTIRFVGRDFELMPTVERY